MTSGLDDPRMRMTHKLNYLLDGRWRPSRAELFGSVFGIGCVNGFAGKVLSTANLRGWPKAVIETFDISAMVVIACVCGICSILRDDDMRQVCSTDVAVCVLLLLVISLPAGAMSWIAVTGLALYILVFSNPGSARRGAVMLLAATVPMLWSRLFFHFLAKPILQVDASLVAWILGTNRAGNLVEFADKSGTLVMLEGCSSLANMSLVLPCWVTISSLSGHKPRRADVFWCLTACASVIAVNVLRISMMGLSMAHYHAIHEGWGDLVVNSGLLVLTTSICLLGVKEDVFAQNNLVCPHHSLSNGGWEIHGEARQTGGHGPNDRAVPG